MAFEIGKSAQDAVASEIVVRIGSLLCEITPLNADDSLERAAYQLKQHGLPALPVARNGILVGMLTSSRMMEAVGSAPMADSTLEALIEPATISLPPDLPVEVAIALLRENGAYSAPVITTEGYYLGMVTAPDLLAAAAGRPITPRLGGMATPLGVYLTTGAVSGGAGDLGLILTGAMMSLTMWVATVIVMLLAALGLRYTGLPFFEGALRIIYDQGVGGTLEFQLGVFVATVGTLVGIFLLLFRLIPRLTGYHAAEHQTVNALEAGEPLTREAVARMSPVHPRCGTNLVSLFKLSFVGVMIITYALSTSWGRGHVPTIIILTFYIVLMIVFFWKRVGAWIQLHLTTRKPTLAEIDSGIRAGEEVLRKHLLQSPGKPRLAARIWRMGLAQVAIGVMLTTSVLGLLDGVLDYLLQSLVK